MFSRWNDVGMRTHGDNIGSMASARALTMVSVDGAPIDGFNGVLDTAGLVERVGVDRHLYIESVGHRKAVPYGSRRLD